MKERKGGLMGCRAGALRNPGTVWIMGRSMNLRRIDSKEREAVSEKIALPLKGEHRPIDRSNH